GMATMVPQVSVDSQGRIINITNVNIAYPVTSVATRTGNVVLTATDIGGLGTAATQNVGILSNDVVQLDPLARLPAVDGSQLANVNASEISGKPVSSTSPTPGQVLTYNNGMGQWDSEALPTGLASAGTSGAIQYSNGLGGLLSNDNIVIDG